MTGQKRKFIDTDDFYSFTVGTFLNSITLNPMEFMASHISSTLGLQTLSLQGSTKTEVVFASFDATPNIGKYCISPTTNSIIIGTDPAIITTQALALDYIVGFLLVYNLIPLSYYGDTELFTMTTKYGTGTLVGMTNPTTFSVIENKISAYDDDINVNTISYYEHTVRRALIAI